MRRLPKILKATRPAAYTSEVGESFRPVMSPGLIKIMYGISWAYVIVDTASATYNVKDKGQEVMKYTCLDKAIWHTLASMVLPAFTIHTVVKFTGKLFKGIFGQKSKLAVWLPVFFGLGSIPFIIHPLDDLTDYLMNNTLRKSVYGDKLPKEATLH